MISRLRAVVAGAVLSMGGLTGALAGGAAPAGDAPPELTHTADMLPEISGGPGFYVRGSVGAAKPVAGSLHTSGPLAPSGTDITGKSDPAFEIGVGAGYRISDWLRVEASVDHAFASDVTADVTCTPCVGTAHLKTSFSQTVGLGSVFFDLPGIWRVSPYVGASLGLAYLEVGHATLSVGPASISDNGASGWNLAWGGSLGALVDLGHGFSADLGYRYLDYANSDLKLSTTGATASARNVQSHAVRLGLIWQPW